jgi:lysozyme family protein
MLTKFDDIIEITLKHEGGYVHDPKDLGGETNFGIAGRFYPDVDIKNLTKQGAKEIYKKDYWDRNKVDDLPDNLKHIYFDMCVNQGRGTAVKVLQRAINGKGGDLKVDGGFGPGTKGALAKYKPSLDRVRCYRLKHYYDLVNKKPEQERFLFGWFKRGLEV